MSLMHSQVAMVWNPPEVFPWNLLRTPFFGNQTLGKKTSQDQAQTTDEYKIVPKKFDKILFSASVDIVGKCKYHASNHQYLSHKSQITLVPSDVFFFARWWLLLFPHHIYIYIYTAIIQPNMLPENRAPCLVHFTPWTSRVKAKSVSWRGLWGLKFLQNKDSASCWKGDDFQQRLRDDEMMWKTKKAWKSL